MSDQLRICVEFGDSCDGQVYVRIDRTETILPATSEPSHRDEAALLLAALDRFQAEVHREVRAQITAALAVVESA